MEKEDGVWRTIRGRRIFIAKGESLGSAMAKSGKFKRSDIREEKTSLRAEDYMNKIKNKSVASKKNQKETDKYYKKTAKKGEYTKFGYEPNANNQVEKNRINENAKVNENAKTRVERNKEKYSDTDRRELRHEELQKKLVDYKAKKQSNNHVETNEHKNVYNRSDKEIDNAIQKFNDFKKYETFKPGEWNKANQEQRNEIARKSLQNYLKENNLTREEMLDLTDVMENENHHTEANLLEKEWSKQSNNKVETEKELYERAKNNPDSIDPMTENSTDWEALEKKYGNKVDSQDMPYERDLQDVVKTLNDEGSDFSWSINEYKDGKANLNVGVFMPDERGYVDRNVEFDLKGIKGNTAEGYSQIEDKIREWQDKHSSPDTFYDDDNKQEKIRNYVEKKQSNKNVKQPITRDTYTMSKSEKEINNINTKEGFYDKVREIIGYNNKEWNDKFGWEDWEIKRLQRVADARYEELNKRKKKDK